MQGVSSVTAIVVDEAKDFVGSRVEKEVGDDWVVCGQSTW